MRKIVLAAFAAAVLFCLPAWAAGETQTFLNPPISSKGIGIVNSSTTCGTTALLFASPGAGTMRLSATGTFTSGNIRVQASIDGVTSFTTDLTVYPRAGGAGATTIAAAGEYTLPILGDMQVCIYGSAFTGSVTVLTAFVPAASRVIVSNTAADPLFVTGALSVSGTADVVSAGAPTTFSSNAVCTGSLLLAGEQTATFELNAGTLAATLTPQCSNEVSGTTNFTNGVFKDASGTATNTLVVTNPNALTNLQVVCPGARRAQVCTTAFTSGSATGLANGVFFQGGAAAGGGGGGVVTQPTGSNLHTVTDTGSTTAVTALPATPAGTNLIGKVGIDQTTPGTTNGVQVNAALPAGTNLLGKTGIDQTTPGTTNGVVVNSLPATPAGTNLIGKFGIDQTTPGTTNGVVVNGTASTQGVGTANSPAGGVGTFQPPLGSTVPMAVYTPGGTGINANAADTSAAAATLTAACTSQTACGATSSIQWSMTGLQGATVTLTTSTSALGTALTCDESWDGVAGAGVTFLLGGCDMWQNHGAYRIGALTNADAVLAATSTQQWIIYAPGSPSNIRIRMATLTSGNVTLAGRGTMAPNLPFPVEARTTFQNQVTLTASTSETTLLASQTGVFQDLTYLKCSNTSSTASVISLRDATAGTVRDTIVCQAAISPCEGGMYRVPFRQTAVTNNWTIQAGTSASSIVCTAQAVPR